MLDLRRKLRNLLLDMLEQTLPDIRQDPELMLEWRQSLNDPDLGKNDEILAETLPALMASLASEQPPVLAPAKGPRPRSACTG